MARKKIIAALEIPPSTNGEVGISVRIFPGSGG